MDSILSFKEKRNVEVEKEVTHEVAIDFIKSVESETKLKIIPLLREVMTEKIDSFSLRKENPDISVYVGGTVRTVMIKFRSESKEAEISIPKDMGILPKK